MASQQQDKPHVFVSRSIPPTVISRLQQFCNVTLYLKDVPVFISREEFKKLVVGVDALFVHPPDRVDKELLDLAGEVLKFLLGYLYFLLECGSLYADRNFI